MSRILLTAVAYPATSCRVFLSSTTLCRMGMTTTATPIRARASTIRQLTLQHPTISGLSKLKFIKKQANDDAIRWFQRSSSSGTTDHTPQLRQDGSNNTVQPSSRDSTHNDSWDIPEPTWSISDLQLTQNHPPISKQLLHQLCHRACLYPGTDQTQQEQLQQDLGNLWHMIEQIQQVSTLLNKDEVKDESSVSANHEDDDMVAFIYDIPRGLYPQTPLSSGGIDDPAASKLMAEEEEAEASDRVRESLLRPKLNYQLGGHSYFAIVTWDTDETSKQTKTTKQSKGV